jgi:hypothetical protein
MGKAIPLFALIPSFLASTVTGAVLGVLAIKLLKSADIIELKSYAGSPEAKKSRK